MVFFDELVDPFYETLGSDFAQPAKFRQGQIFWAPVPYSEEQRQYWRPVDYDKLTQTSAKDFNIVGGGTDLFNRALPLYAPRLEVNEEFIVVRAKLRPVILIAVPGVGILGKHSHHHLVIPRFGAVKGNSDQPKLPPAVTDRIRTLEYPEILFTPACEPHLSKDGFLAVHLLQPMPLSSLKPTPLALGDKALAVVHGQVLHRCFNEFVKPYAEWREMLLNPDSQ